MTSTSRNARIAGLLYLLLAIAGPLRLMYIPKTLFVHGDAAVTAANITAHETHCSSSSTRSSSRRSIARSS